MKAYWIMPFAMLLAGCAGGQLTVSGGQCKLPSVHTPPVAVAGKTQYDQNWIDDTTEGLVRGCDQPRPAARPAELDNLPPPKAITKPPVKKKFWQRARKPKSVPLPPEKPITPLQPAAPITPPVIMPVEPRPWWRKLIEVLP